jgi:hypothetical protein
VTARDFAGIVKGFGCRFVCADSPEDLAEVAAAGIRSADSPLVVELGPEA